MFNIMFSYNLKCVYCLIVFVQQNKDSKDKALSSRTVVIMVNISG